MRGDELAIVGANALMLLFGAGLLPLLRLAGSLREVAFRLPLAYAVGIAGVGILTADLALVDVPVGGFALPILAVAMAMLGAFRLRRGGGERERFTIRLLPAAAVLALVAGLLVAAGRLFAIKPLQENDGWALWGLRARALYDFGHPVAPVFTSPPYPGLQYPLFLPGLESIDFRFMRTFNGTVVHLQLLGLAVAFVAAAWTLFRRHSASLLLAATLLLIVVAPNFFGQLQTNSADVPLAMTIALGVAAIAAWLKSGDAGLLPAASLFLTAGALTKNEGEVFAGAAYIVAIAVAGSGRRLPILRAAAATVLLVLPWHIWLLAHDVTATTFHLSHLLHPEYLVHHADRVSSAARQLLAQIWHPSSWGRISIFLAVCVAAAVFVRRYRVAAFGAGWLLLSFAGLLCVYWASPLPLSSNLYFSANRTIDTLVIGGALLCPLLLGPDRPPDRE